MKKKALSILLCAAVTMTLLSGCGGSDHTSPDAAAETEKTSDTQTEQASSSGSAMVLQLAHVNPSTDEDNLQHTCLTFADKLSELSGGTIEVKVVGDSQLGTDREAIEGMQMGTVDMSFSMNSSLGSFLPALQVFDLPFLFGNRDQVYAVFDDEEIMGPLKQQLYEEAGVYILGVGDNGFRNCLNNIKPINGVDDVKGMKLRLAENAIWSDCFSAFGASPTAMAFSEVYTACQQGTVDGFELPTASVYSGAYWEVCDYYSLTEHLFTAMDLCISGMTWDSLTEEQKQWVQEASDYAIEENRRYIQEKEAGWLDEIAENMEVNECADKSGFVEAAQKVYANYADEIGQELLDTVMDKIASVQ